MMGNLREKTEEEMSSGSETQTSSTCFKETKVPIFKDSGIDISASLSRKPTHREQDSVKSLMTTTLDEKALLEKMHARFKRKKDQYQKNATYYKYFNNSLSFLLIIFQIALILITVIQGDGECISDAAKACSVILSALTAALIGIQLSLRWGEKSKLLKEAADSYSRLHIHTTSKLQMLECGGELGDSTKFWEDAIKIEETQSPKSLLPY